VSETECPYADQAALTAAYDSWLSGFTVVNDGCSATGSFDVDPPASLDFCDVNTNGVNISATWSANDGCTSDECTSTFMVIGSPDLSVNCPVDPGLDACSTEQEILDAYNTWVAGFIVNDGCADETSNIDDIPELPAYVCGAAINLSFTLSATDECNANAVECSSTFTVAENQLPEIVCPPDITIECSESTDPSNTGTATGTDDCIVPIPTFVDDITLNGCPEGGVITRTWTVTDECGNTDSCDQIITVVVPSIAVTKTVASGTTNNGDGTYTFTYHIRAENDGETVLNNLQVTDNLETTFAGALGYTIDSYGIITQPVSTTLVDNVSFDGGVFDENLLDGNESLLIGEFAVIQITVTLTPGPNLGPYNNVTVASGSSNTNVEVTDDADISILLEENPELSVFKIVSSEPVYVGNGTYFLVYEVRVENTGDIILHNLQLEDDMTLTFVGVDGFNVNSVNITVQPASNNLFLNPGYDGGVSDANLLDGNESLVVGEFAVLEIGMLVTPGTFLGPYINSAIGTGTSPADNEVTDLSDSETEVDGGTIIFFPPNGQISDFVWEDLDGDGIQDPGEPGVDGVVVNLYDDLGNLIQTTSTSGGGLYLFDNVLPGNYYVEFVPSDDWDFTFPNEGGDPLVDSDAGNDNGPGTSSTLVIMNGDTITSLDAGLYHCINIGELVWYDTNLDDIWNDAENGINGIEVNLYRLTNGVWVLWDTDITGHKPGTPSDDGYYKFCAPPGQYYIEVPIEPQYQLVPVLPFIGLDTLRDSDFDDSNGPFTTPTYTFFSGEEHCNISAGFYPMALMGDYVWDDVNVNGIQDNGEDFFPGVTVEVFNEQGQLVGTDVSDIHGKFEMDFLQKKKYYLRVYAPTGYGFTTPNVGNDDFDSDIDGSNGQSTTALYQMNPGVDVLSVDVGLTEGALPLDLLSFDGENKGKENHLYWKTTNEINVEKFVVERSTDNFEFSDIGEVQTLVNNSSNKDYTLIDDDFELGVLYYYRLRIIDLDGSYEFSNIISLISEKKGVFSVDVYPIPSDRIINIKMENIASDEVKLNVFNINSSRVIETEKVEIERNSSGNYLLVKDFSNYSPGVYILEIEAGNDVVRKRIILVQ
jgi:hypothetical protein